MKKHLIFIFSVCFLYCATIHAAELNYKLKECLGECADSARCKSTGPRMLGDGAIFGHNQKQCASIANTKSRAYRIENDWAKGFTFKCKKGREVVYQCIYEPSPNP